jgi:peptidyl-tRNA hydrolase, PTH1 family
VHILLGLGNPGPKYDQTRHNIGFALADRLVEDAGQAGAWKSESKCLTRKITLAGSPLLVAKPQTYMNLSGEAAQALLAFYKVPPQRMVVAVDEVYLDLGTVRIRSQGSAGGHNGMRSLIQHCGDEFVRIRIGVGPCPPGQGHSDFVLKKYGPEESRAFEPVLAQFRTLMET